MMKVILLFIFLVSAHGQRPALSVPKPIPRLTGDDALLIREAQLRLTRAENRILRLQLSPEWREAQAGLEFARSTLQAIIESFKPASCPKCDLMDDLTWKEPAPPPPQPRTDPAKPDPEAPNAKKPL